MQARGPRGAVLWCAVRSRQKTSGSRRVERRERCRRARVHPGSEFTAQAKRENGATRGTNEAAACVVAETRTSGPAGTVATRTRRVNAVEQNVL